MSRVSTDIPYTVTLWSALHIGTGFGLAQIIDDRIVTGPHPARPDIELPYAPGSSVKGRLRHYVRELLAVQGWSADDARAAETRLFGAANAPGPLIFTDAHLADGEAGALANAEVDPREVGAIADRAFVSLSRGRRVALEQRLFRIEIAPPGLTFHGRIHGTRLDTTQAHDLALLAAAARLMSDVGGHNGRGLGSCQVALGVTIPDPTVLEAAPGWPAC